MVLFLLLAAAARLGQLTWYSIDVDEGVSYGLTQLPIRDLLQNTLTVAIDPHPFVYYLLLRPIIALVGPNDVGIHLFSALSGILFIALLYQLGRHLFGTRAAQIAALLAALNAILIYESLDARMYMLAGTFAVAGLYALLKQRWVVALVCFTLLGYTHVVGIIVLATLGAATSARALLEWRANRPNDVRASVWSIGVVTLSGLLTLPYLLILGQASGTSGVVTRDVLGFGELLLFTARTVLFYQAALPNGVAIGVALLVGVAVLYGVWGLRNRPILNVWLTLLLIVPLLLIVILSQRQAILQPKMYVAMTVPPLLLLIGGGLGLGWHKQRAVSGVLLGLLVITSLFGMRAIFQPPLQRENWRAAADYLNQLRGTNDTTIAHLHFYENPLEFYLKDNAETPFGSHLTDEAEVERGLAPFLNSEVIWLAQSGHLFTDPDSLLENWLAARYPLVTAQFPSNITLKGFLINAVDQPPLAGTVEHALVYDNGVQVTGAWIDQKRLAATDVWLHPPSNWLHVVVYGNSAEYQLTIEDDGGNVWGGQLPRTGVPLPTTPNTIIRHDYDLNLNPDMPPGIYKVVLRQAGNIPHNGGVDWYILDTVEIIK